MAAPLHYTADMVRHLNDLHEWRWPRYEVVDGELLVTPAPRRWHQEIVRRLLVALSNYLDQEPVAHVFTSPADITWGAERLVQPDVFVVPKEHARTREWREMDQLLLVIEVLSMSTARGDRLVKRRLYQRHGVPLYWLIDADAKLAEVWTPTARKARIARDVLVWQPEGASQPFVMSLDELFLPI
ncbi:MAG TPA: Uma2 family endonuclease [Gemmatimonadaceae bacterium]|nr:Uma2 family endonuclease [Gemmatimonadaceae bacterium]